VLDRYEDSGDKAACRALTTLTHQLRALTGKKVPNTAAPHRPEFGVTARAARPGTARS
jgi:hypothetical protein